MAREWSRRSIEELVRGYMRRHTPPSSDSSCDGADYMIGQAVIPNLYDAAGQELALPMYEIDIVTIKKLGVQIPDVMYGIKFGEVPPVYFKSEYNHVWVIGLFASCGEGLGNGALFVDLYDEAGGLVTTVYTMPSSIWVNPFSSIMLPQKLEFTKHPNRGWKNFPGCFFGTEAVRFTLLYATSDNATNPLPEGWANRAVFYKARSPYD